MREQARIFLEIMREANRERVRIPQELGPILKKHLGITWQEVLEIGEVLKADVRETFIDHPDFAVLNTELEKFPKLDQS